MSAQPLPFFSPSSLDLLVCSLPHLFFLFQKEKYYLYPNMRFSRTRRQPLRCLNGVIDGRAPCCRGDKTFRSVEKVDGRVPVGDEHGADTESLRSFACISGPARAMATMVSGPSALIVLANFSLSISASLRAFQSQAPQVPSDVPLQQVAAPLASEGSARLWQKARPQSQPPRP